MDPNVSVSAFSGRTAAKPIDANNGGTSFQPECATNPAINEHGQQRLGAITTATGAAEVVWRKSTEAMASIPTADGGTSQMPMPFDGAAVEDDVENPTKDTQTLMPTSNYPTWMPVCALIVSGVLSLGIGIAAFYLLQ